MKSKQVVFITDAYSFPNGMASTQRTRLLAKGLVENGINVTVLCVKAIERPPLLNTDAKGFYEGAYFEYTPGTTARPENFMKRRWLDFRGLVVAILRLISLKANDGIYCIYLCPTMVMKFTPNAFIYRFLAKLLRIPVILEIVEYPWSLKKEPAYWEKKVSPLVGATGSIVISDFLLNWVLAESRRTSKKMPIMYIPSMVDFEELNAVSSKSIPDIPKVLFAGSPVYDETIRFIIRSMSYVFSEIPICQLVITGSKKNDPRGSWMQSEKIDQGFQNRVILAGYLSRNDLLALFKESSALLIPLFDDITSRARFPIKLVEYLASGRPVITTNVGEIPRYLKNGWNAFICEPGDPKAFAELIIAALRNPAQANEVGLRGKDVALQNFDYPIWVRKLSEFIRAL